MPSKMTEPIGAPPERWIVITGKIFKRSTNVKRPAADRLPVLQLIQRQTREITPLGLRRFSRSCQASSTGELGRPHLIHSTLPCASPSASARRKRLCWDDSRPVI